MRMFRVRVKEYCSACPFDGTCKQCGGKGWYYTEQIIPENDICEVENHE